ncbi:hypothetical protein C1646_784951 [Rhizophagus diaphanus]|nr:hypothetical protein C1646_784951 [Rhizophagus diaphanus] [Rhizophagus sp. MUCL 43196]
MAARRKMYSILYLKSGQGWSKDKVTSDTIEIHEKYKTPTQYKNFMSTIVLTNENALRVENNDRRTVFLDVLPIQKRNLEYFKKLSNAIKYPDVSKAFYAYLRVIADTHSDFNGNPPPITTSKQEHIISTLPPLFQFIKDSYLIEETVTENDVNDFLECLLSCEPGPSNSSPIKSEPPVKPEPPAPETAKKNIIEPLAQDSQPKEDTQAYWNWLE